MKILECRNSNDNVNFLFNILNTLNIDRIKDKWVISDLYLVPVFHGDYSGVGKENEISPSYEFLKKVEEEKTVIISNDELCDILQETQSIRNGVFICLDREYDVDVKTYHPRVESDVPDQLYDERAKYEIRILDGGLFIIL